jgi:NAD(P)-dependent dehydrogenase (short-subunit alcohol dehydrogenase family)
MPRAYALFSFEGNVSADICIKLSKTAMLHDVHVGSSSAVDLLRRKQPLNGAGDPDDIARTAVVLASDDASFVTGVCLPEDGGFTIH